MCVCVRACAYGPDSQIMISRKCRSFCLQPCRPSLCCRRLLRVLHVDHVAQFLLLGQPAKLSHVRQQTKTKRRRRRPRQPHLQPRKHPGPLVAEAIHLHGAQLPRRGLLVNLLLHLPVKLFLIVIFLLSRSFRNNDSLQSSLTQNRGVLTCLRPLPLPVVLQNESLLAPVNLLASEALQSALQLFLWGLGA